MSRNTTVQNLLGYLKRFEGPKGWKQWLATSLTALIVVALVAMTWGLPWKQTIPVWGRCLHPTIRWISISEPLAWLSFSGWVHYRTNLKGVEPEVGNIAYFREPGKPRTKDLKRIERKQTLPNGKKRYWMRRDNTGVTGDGSGEGRYNWVEEEYVIGVVDRIYTPEWLMRERTPRGRYLNKIRFVTPAQDVQLTQYIEVRDHARHEIARYSMDGEFMGWLEPTPMPEPVFKRRTVVGEAKEIASISCESVGADELKAVGDVRRWLRPGTRILVRYEGRFKPEQRGRMVWLTVVSTSRVSPYTAWPYGATRIRYEPETTFDPDWSFYLIHEH